MNLTLRLDNATPAPAAARQPTVAARVFDVLRQAIVQLQVRPGHLLSEADIAKQLGVSRQPVREAFIKLAEARLVEIRPQRGTLVLLISRRDVENARFLREAIEVAIARKAAEEIGEDDLATMRELLATQRDAQARGDVGAFMRADDAYHLAIARSADCEYAWRVLEGLKVQFDRVRYLSMPLATPVDTLIGQHQRVYDALAAHEPDAAEAAMREHLSEVLKSLPKIAAANPDLFVD